MIAVGHKTAWAAEGWYGLVDANGEAHYYRHGTPLCGVAPDYSGIDLQDRAEHGAQLLPDDGSASPDDCQACRQALDGGSK